MFSKYLSHWLIIYFNICLQSYNIFVKKYKYEYSFLSVKIITHLLPFILSYYLIKNKHKYALINLLIIIILYIIYMNYIDRNIYHTYLIYKPPLNWNEYFKLCDTKEGEYIPYCFLYNNNNNNV